VGWLGAASDAVEGVAVASLGVDVGVSGTEGAKSAAESGEVDDAGVDEIGEVAVVGVLGDDVTSCVRAAGAVSSAKAGAAKARPPARVRDAAVMASARAWMRMMLLWSGWCVVGMVRTWMMLVTSC